MTHGPELVPPGTEGVIAEVSTFHAPARKRTGAIDERVGLPEQAQDVPLEERLEGGDGREFLSAQPGAGGEDAAEQREDVAARAGELPDCIEALPQLRDATGDGVELRSWDHGMITRGHALGETGDEVTAACDHHKWAALAVIERQCDPDSALGPSNLFEQSPDEERVLVERECQLGLGRGQALESFEEVNIVSMRHGSFPRDSRVTCKWGPS